MRLEHLPAFRAMFWKEPVSRSLLSRLTDRAVYRAVAAPQFVRKDGQAVVRLLG